jgi:hypothetical protein
MLNVFMLSVIMLSVVAPTVPHLTNFVKNNYQGLFVDCLDFEIQDSELERFAEKQNK